MNVFAMRGAIPSSIHRFHVACLYYSLHGKHGSSLEIDFYWYELCAHFPHDLLSVQGSYKDCYVETLLIQLGVESYPLGVDLSLPGVDLLLPS